MGTEYVPNELLAYAFDVYSRDKSDDIEDVLLNFYDDKAVRSAKTLIWEKYNEKLPSWKDRRNTTSNPNNAKERDVSDILGAIKLIDEKYSSKDEVLPFVFAAIRLKNVPSERYASELSVRNRLAVLEAQMGELLVAKQSYAATAAAGPELPALSIHTRRNERNIPGQPLPRVDHGRRIPGLLSEPRVNVDVSTRDVQSNNRVAQEARGNGGTPSENLSGDVQSRTGGSNNNTDNSHDYGRGEGRGNGRDDGRGEGRGDGRGFTTVERRRRRGRAVYGTGNNDDLSAGLQKHDLFVFQVNADKKEQDVKSYLEKRDVKVVKIKRMSADEAASNSFHVEIHCMDVRTILTPGFWPTGVGSRKFVQKRRSHQPGRQQQNFD